MYSLTSSLTHVLTNLVDVALLRCFWVRVGVSLNPNPDPTPNPDPNPDLVDVALLGSLAGHGTTGAEGDHAPGEGQGWG